MNLKSPKRGRDELKKKWRKQNCIKKNKKIHNPRKNEIIFFYIYIYDRQRDWFKIFSFS